jgi:hypothetical protein
LNPDKLSNPTAITVNMATQYLIHEYRTQELKFNWRLISSQVITSVIIRGRDHNPEMIKQRKIVPQISFIDPATTIGPIMLPTRTDKIHVKRMYFIVFVIS